VSVRLAQSDETLLEAVQRMLLRLGIASIIYRDRRPAGPRLLPDGNGGTRAYFCRADHELVVSGDNLLPFAELVGFTDTAKQARLRAALAGYKRSLNRERFIATVAAVAPEGTEEVFDASIPGINAFDANGLYVHNCGELPLPPYGACDLGSINLTRFVHEPFSPRARLDLDIIAASARLAVRMMDNTIDASQFPLAPQAEQARGTRRVGLGLTGLADALIMLNLHYGEEPARRLAAEAMRVIGHAAYSASIELAREKGPFPFFERDKYLQGPFIRRLPPELQEGIARHGIRNSHVTAIAPTGTISLLANNVSSGLEPVYDFCHSRRMLEPDGQYRQYELQDYAFQAYRAQQGTGPLPRAFVNAAALAPEAHLAMQAALQPFVDSSISKTINVPRDYAFGAFQDIYARAYDLGLKGCTTFRPNPVTGAVLASEEREEGLAASHCCNIEREGD
jgi:ribonucleoside-diphosphate reductase alpha chain